MRVFKPVFAGLLPLFLAGGPSLALAQQPASVAEAKKPTAEEKKKLREKALQLLDDTVAEIQTLKREENRLALSIQALKIISRQYPAKTRVLAESIIATIVQNDAAPPPTEDENDSPVDQLLENRNDNLTSYENTLVLLAMVDDAAALELFGKTRRAFIGHEKPGNARFFSDLEQRLELIAARGNPEKLHAAGQKLLEQKKIEAAIELISRIRQKNPSLAAQFFAACLDWTLSDEQKPRPRASRLLELIKLVPTSEETSAKADSGTKSSGGKKELLNIAETTRCKLFIAFGQTLLERLKFPPKGSEPSFDDGTDDDSLLRWTKAGKSALPEIGRHDSKLAEQVSSRIETIEAGVRITADRNPEQFLAGLEDGTVPFEQIENVQASFMETMVKAGHLDRLRRLIERIPDPQLREIRLRQLDEVQTAQTTPTTSSTPESGPSPEKTLSRNARSRRLLQLADAQLQKKEYAKAAESLDQALAIAGQLERPYARRTIECEIADQFFRFNPDRGFEIYESYAGLTNELLSALALLAENRESFGSGWYVKNEFSVTSINTLANHIAIINFPFQTASLLDFDRTRALVDRIRYPEIRSLFRLVLINSVLSANEPTSDTPSDTKEENPQR
jgi:hypothetical protein